MKMKPRTAITHDEISQALQTVRRHIPNDTFDQFLDQIYSAVEIYLGLDEPSIVTKELREINRICQKPNYTLLNILENICTTTKDLLEGSNLLEGAKPLPTFPDKEDKAGINALAQDIHQRIVLRGKKLSDRFDHHLIGPSKQGRPSKNRLSVLVSFVATAYVSATEKSYRRRWDTDGDLPFHLILEALFKALGIDASADEAIKRQQKA